MISPKTIKYKYRNFNNEFVSEYWMKYEILEDKYYPPRPPSQWKFILDTL
jgi:hypothetical protein